MARAFFLSLIALVGAGLLGALAFAADDRPRQFARLERLEIEPYFANLTRVRAFVNVLKLEGDQINVKPEELQLVVGDARLRAIPGITRFEFSGVLVDVVVVLAVHSSFASALEELEEPLNKTLGRLNDKTARVALVTYGAKTKTFPLENPAAAMRRLRRVVSDDVPDPPMLVDALTKAVRIHTNTKPMVEGAVPRRLIFVISDGNDQNAQGEETKDDFRKVTKLANAAGITIHTVAFSLNDNRTPYLNLAEISKKTTGTFRMAANRAELVPHLESFAQELRQQLVLTFLLPESPIKAGDPVSVACKSARCGPIILESNTKRAPKLGCAGAECEGSQACVQDRCMAVAMSGATSGAGKLVAIFIAIAAGGGGAAFLYKRKKAKEQEEEEEEERAQHPQQPGQPPMIPGQPQIYVPQPIVPDMSNMPYVGGSAALQQMNQQLANLPYVGAAMAAQQRAAAPPVAAPSARGASIMVLSGPQQGQTFPLRHGFTIGKVRGCDLVLDDGYTSNHHAQFHVDLGGGCTVVDLGSSNGIYVNGVRATQQRLTHGMALRVGQTDIRFLQGQG